MSDLVKTGLSSLQLRELERLGRRLIRFGVNFAICDANNELVLLREGSRFKSNRGKLSELSRITLNQHQDICRFDEDHLVLVAVLKSSSEVVGTVLVDLGSGLLCDMRSGNSSDCAGMECKINCLLFCEILETFARSFQSCSRSEERVEIVGLFIFKLRKISGRFVSKPGLL